MPTYTYKCNNERCSEHEIHFEIKQKMSDDTLVICPECGMKTLSRVIVAGGSFVLKGSGWFNKGGY